MRQATDLGRWTRTSPSGQTGARRRTTRIRSRHADSPGSHTVRRRTEVRRCPYRFARPCCRRLERRHVFSRSDSRLPLLRRLRPVRSREHLHEGCRAVPMDCDRVRVVRHSLLRRVLSGSAGRGRSPADRFLEPAEQRLGHERKALPWQATSAHDALSGPAGRVLRHEPSSSMTAHRHGSAEVGTWIHGAGSRAGSHGPSLGFETQGPTRSE